MIEKCPSDGLPVDEPGQYCSAWCYSTWLLLRIHVGDGLVRLDDNDVLPLPLDRQPWYEGFVDGSGPELEL